MILYARGMNARSVDLAIVGAGTAGLATALCAARAGLGTLVLDRRPLSETGARWVNAVQTAAFERLGIAPPSGPERVSDAVPFYMFAGRGPTRVVITDHDVPEVDMRHLVARLQERARAAGATLEGDVRVAGVEDGVLRTSADPVRARWIVDASGLAGARLLARPAVHAGDLCAAAQTVRVLRDERAARAFWARHDAEFGRNLCFTGIAGGYSILNVSAHGGHVGILSGSIPADGYPSGEALVRRFVAEQPWIGDEVFGGSRAIPVRRPLDRLTDGQVIALGDAGLQVYASHGSGIAVGMDAGRTLVDALVAGRSPYAWSVEWQRSEGAALAANEVFRRFTQTLSPAEVETLMVRGLMDARTARAGKEQVPPSFELAEVPGKVAALLGSGSLGARLARTMTTMAAATALYRRYPADPRRVDGWARAAALLFREPLTRRPTPSAPVATPTARP